MKLKLWGNWGLWLTVFLILFVLGNVAFVIIVSNINFDMVEDNYYEKELKYQQKIDKMSKLHNLKDSLTIVRTEGKKLIIDFPDDLKGKTFKGNIHFYRPNDRKMDFNIEIKPDSNMQQTVDYSKTAPGIWVIKIEWQSNGDEYYYEEELVL